MEIKDVIDALRSSAGRQNASLMPHPTETADGRVLFVKGPVNVCLTPVMHTSEMELSAEIAGTPGKIFGDAIQTWLGDAIHAYMFSDKTVEKVADNVVGDVFKILERFQNSFELSIRSLESVNRRLSNESQRNWLREEAEKAWKSRGYKEAVELYTKLAPNLSEAEEKRVKIARQMLK